MADAKNLPAFKARYGNITVTVWENKLPKGSVFSESITKSYKDKTGNWQTTPSLKFPGDFHKAILAHDDCMRQYYNRPKQAGAEATEED